MKGHHVVASIAAAGAVYLLATLGPASTGWGWLVLLAILAL